MKPFKFMGRIEQTESFPTAIGHLTMLFHEAVGRLSSGKGRDDDRLVQIANEVFLALTGKQVRVDQFGETEFRRPLDLVLTASEQDYYEGMLDEIQASIVLAGGAKPTTDGLERMTLKKFLEVAVRNHIRYRIIYHPRLEELMPPPVPPPRSATSPPRPRLAGVRLSARAKCPKCGVEAVNNEMYGEDLLPVHTFSCPEHGPWTLAVDWGSLLNTYIRFNWPKRTEE